VDEVTSIANSYFPNVLVLFWQVGRQDKKPEILRRLDEYDYNLLVSYLNGIILTSDHLAKALYGAINIHPAPPEHGGTWGTWCQPVVRRNVRKHHGITVHEIAEKIDTGAIYRVRRWDVAKSASIESVMKKSFLESLGVLNEVLAELAASSDGTACFTPLDERWDHTNRHTRIDEIRRWFAELPSDHPAHNERVIFNHPRAILSPPYFDDLEI
jgi:methionyl-tRNA formyltransferase